MAQYRFAVFAKREASLAESSPETGVGGGIFKWLRLLWKIGESRQMCAAILLLTRLPTTNRVDFAKLNRPGFFGNSDI
jgi:hypothetical protein